MIEPMYMVKWLTDFISKYRNRELPIEYYRELDRGNSYSLFDSDMGKYINVSDTNEIDSLNISTNYLNYVLPLSNLYI
jgi:hypothetical protein